MNDEWVLLLFSTHQSKKVDDDNIYYEEAFEFDGLKYGIKIPS